MYEKHVADIMVLPLCPLLESILLTAVTFMPHFLALIGNSGTGSLHACSRVRVSHGLLPEFGCSVIPEGKFGDS